MKPAFPFQFLGKKNNKNSSKQEIDYARRRRYVRIFMLVDLVFVAAIFLYFHNYTEKQKISPNKVQSSRYGNHQLSFHVSYLDELKLYSFYLTAEKIKPKPTKNEHPATIKISLATDKNTLATRSWRIPKDMNVGEVKTYRLDISWGRIAAIFQNSPELVIKAKQESLISFDRDKLAVQCTVAVNKNILIKKKYLLEK